MHVATAISLDKYKYPLVVKIITTKFPTVFKVISTNLFILLRLGASLCSRTFE